MDEQGDSGRFARVLAHIDAHLDEALSIDRLRRVAGLSTHHFQRRFKAELGETPWRWVQRARLRRAVLRLAFERAPKVVDVALEAGFENAESFSRAFTKALGRSPRAFARAPAWDRWWNELRRRPWNGAQAMQVRIVQFPETRVALLEHRGSPALEYATARRFVEWRRAHGYPPDRHRTYGVHHDDPFTTPPDQYRMDLCISVDADIAPNDFGVVNAVLPACRCAVARHLGSRDYIAPAKLLHTQWLPGSGERRGPLPMFFHYVNVGPDVREHEMITDVYVPLLG